MTSLPRRLRRHALRRGVLYGLLALVVLRATVPAGFMLATQDSRIGIALCDAATTGAHVHAARHAAGHALHPGGGREGARDHTHPDPACPFAQSAGPAPLPSLPRLAGAVPRPPECAAIPPAVRVAGIPGPQRRHPPRAPPLPA